MNFIQSVREKVGEKVGENVTERLLDRIGSTAKVVDEIVAHRFPYRHRQIEREPLESDDDSSEDNLPWAKTTFPQDIKFTVPEDVQAGAIVCIQGPHGPIRVQLPEDAEPGKDFSWRLGPPDQISVDVPEDVEPGTFVQFMGENGEALCAPVPKGLKPGDKFSVGPPVIMVQVPKDAVAGSEVVFMSPFGERLGAKVPEGLSQGQYFPVSFNMPQQAPAPVTGEDVTTQPEQDSKSPQKKANDEAHDDEEEPTENDQLVVE